ncbi:helix-turn-helix domain-containing protein [Nonomuraea rubra]|uniref:helix-turn-helix domain-containing protein n=1 Tax=Nonomuraea rubra TaxID=46180 RepID=UPI0033FDE55E
MDVIDVWTGRMAKTLRATLRLSQESFAQRLGVVTRTVANWEAKHDQPLTVHAHDLLDTALHRAPDSVKARFAACLDLPSTRADVTVVGHHPREVLMAAAYESAEDAALRAGSCGLESIADLHDRTVAAARAYSSSPPLEVFVDTKAIRDLARTLTNRTHRPSNLADLYVILGQTNALMGSIAFDLGNWQAAASLARSATTYAELAGHGSLLAWALGLQGTLAFWRDEPERSLGFVSRGLSVAPKGAPRYRLRYIASRAHAVQGNGAAVAATLAAARADRDDRDDFVDELDHEVRGEFVFDDARAAACAAAAWLLLHDGDQAASYARRALDQYAHVPANRRPFSPVTGVTIDLAAAHLLSGNYSEAASELETVFTLPQELRNVSLAGRIAKVKAILSRPEFGCDAKSRQLSGRISDWLNETAAKPDAVEGVTG